MSSKKIQELLTLFEEFGYVPVIAAEIEFYLYGDNGEDLDEPRVISDIQNAIKDADINLLEIEKERGEGQYEIKLGCSFYVSKFAVTPSPFRGEGWGGGATPSNELPNHKLHKRSILQFADDLMKAKDIAIETAKIHNATATFEAKPFPERPASGLHIHLHLEDNNGRNLFYREEESYSDIMLYSIGGLLATMKENITSFLPNEKSYERIRHAKKETPSTVSWGNNNRTVAIRIPENRGNERRIEHRVAGADADPEAVITAILDGVYYGITHRTKPTIPQTFGDAYLDMYGLEKLV